VLKLNPLEPLLPEPDPRDSGMVVHAWLEHGLRHTPHVTAENAEALVAFMRDSIPAILADAPPVLQVVWAPRLQRLAPDVVAWWQARGGEWQTERKLTAHMAQATVHAILDAFTANGSKGAEILDYKTGTPPAKGKLKTGEAPQLPIEAWLAAQAGTPIETLTYVQVKGYGETPLRAISMPAAPLVEPVAQSLNAVLETYFTPHADWRALPDGAGLGVLPTGACKTCVLSGVCRREEASV
jgi:ATP-dependent helicase/nuclease subunit B